MGSPDHATAAPASAGTVPHDDDLAFTAIERRLKAYLRALWRSAPPVRTATPGTSPELPRRASFAGGVVTMPDSFRGYPKDAAATLFRAAIAHIAAHLAFGGPKFPVGGLKPVQIALVSLVEDARVEHLAMRTLPGLRRLWMPFHVVEASGAPIAPVMLARLARALIDPEYQDSHGWVAKGREMFLAAEDRWDDPAISRAIGNLLGNDLGQMRVQFNARTYIVEPPYRDDNQGLWEFDDPGMASHEPEPVLAAVRLERAEDGGPPPGHEREEPQDGAAGEANHATIAPLDPERGVPVARYPEWDHHLGRERPDWTTAVEYEPVRRRAGAIDAILERNKVLVDRISALIRSAKVSRPSRLRRQAEGDQFDIDAAIGSVIDRRLGLMPDSRIYFRQVRRYRDLSVLLLLDISQSTNDIVPGVSRSVLELEREAAALLAHGMAGLGDRFAIRAFCSDGRADVHSYTVKDFDAPYDDDAKRRLAGLTGRFSTRLGAAIRHAGQDLLRQTTYRRLLLVITDGEPSDIDVADPLYLVEDTRRAVQTLAHAGIDVFCVGLDAGGDKYLSRMFGRRNVLQIDRLERLPERLSMLYLTLTS